MIRGRLPAPGQPGRTEGKSRLLGGIEIVHAYVEVPVLGTFSSGQVGGR